jgi:hypothetical protein
MLPLAQAITEMTDQKDHTNQNQNGKKMGKGEIGEFLRSSLSQKIMQKCFHAYLPKKHFHYYNTSVKKVQVLSKSRQLQNCGNCAILL